MKRGLDERALQRLVAAATTAPSLHNSQPWRFALHPDRIDVHGDPGRQLSVEDPLARELHISCGTAVLNLRIALRAVGRHADVQLLPIPDDPWHFATVTVGAPARVNAQDRALNTAIWQRHTQRGPFSERPVDEPTRARLADAARLEGAALTFLDEPDRDAVLSVIRSAEARLNQDLDYRLELLDWTSNSDRRDGVPTWAYGPEDRARVLPLRDFTAGGLNPSDRATQPYERSSVIAVLTTAEDNPVHWLRAGQALERVLLTATAAGLVASPFTQPLQVPQLRGMLAGTPARWRPQMILRIGYGPRARPTPRRSVNDVID